MSLTSSLNLARNTLLFSADLTEQHLESLLGQVMSKSVDNADIYLQNSVAETWVLEDGLVKKGGFHIDRGFGLRVISGEKTGFAYADDIALSALHQAASSAKNIVHTSGSTLVKTNQSPAILNLYTDHN